MDEVDEGSGVAAGWYINSRALLGLAGHTTWSLSIASRLISEGRGAEQAVTVARTVLLRLWALGAVCLTAGYLSAAAL